MSLGRAVAHNTAIQLTSKVLSTILGLVAFALMAHYLGSDGFGAYGTVTAYLQLFSILADTGLSIMVIQLLGEKLFEPSRLLSSALGLRLILSAISLLLAPVISHLLPYSSLVLTGIAIMTVSFACGAVNQLFTGIYQAKLKMFLPAIFDLIGRISLIGGVLLIMFWHQGLLAMLVVITLTNVLQTTLLIIFSPLQPTPWLSWDKKIIKTILHRTWPIGLSIAFNLVYFKADTLVLSLTRSLSEVGIYSAPYRVLEVLTSVPMMIMGLVLAHLASSWAERKMGDFTRYIQKTLLLLLIVILPIIILTQWWASPIMTLVGGREFIASGPVLQILILATGFIFIGTLFGHLVNVIHRQRQMIWLYAIGAILALAGYILLIPTYSYWAAAWVTVGVEAFIAISAITMVLKVTKIKLSWVPIMNIIISTSIVGLIMILLVPINLYLATIIAGIAYLGLLIWLKVVSWDELKTYLHKAPPVTIAPNG